LKGDEIEFAKSELLKLELKLGKLIDLNLKGEIPTKGFKKHYEPVFVRKENLEKNIRDLEKEIEQLEQAKSSFQVIATKSIDFYNNWQNLDSGERRYIVESITNEVIFDNRTLLFKLKQIAPLSFLELSPNGQQPGTMLWFGVIQQKLLKNI
jgi:site-specific DNA recombinase